jgi:2-keto-4-pentenoate hydratase/2-oxohepta-3-ene-1,7-dioic acid hydratase in catechol pathway
MSMKQISFENRFVTPSKIVCVGRNYHAHINELGNEIPGEMVIFVKPNSSISDDLNAFHAGEVLHYEAELCFLFESGRFSAIGAGLDLTKRELQSKLKIKGLPWERAKGFDGAALFSEFVEMPESLEHISFELDINGKNIQFGETGLMIYKPAEILDEIASFMALSDGDIVMTGTPKGVGCVNAGDVFHVRVFDFARTIVSAKWCAT